MRLASSAPTSLGRSRGWMTECRQSESPRLHWKARVSIDFDLEREAHSSRGCFELYGMVSEPWAGNASVVAPVDASGGLNWAGCCLAAENAVVRTLIIPMFDRMP